MTATLVDAGPLVAFVDAAEPLHAKCVAALRAESARLLTVWPAVTEACHLLQEVPRGAEAVLDMIGTGVVILARLEGDDTSRMADLMRRYADLPMDLADAALVRVAEREGLTRILTLDRKDFQVYRIGRAGRFTILP